MKTTTALRQLLRQPGIIVAPGAYDCLTAKLIEREGFPVVYMTGAGTAVTRVGKPDLGFRHSHGNAGQRQGDCLHHQCAAHR